GERAGTAIERACAWLRQHAAALGAGHILAPILARADLAEAENALVAHGLEWLEHHYATADAEFVLRHLLRRAELTPKDRHTAAARALERLETLTASPGASFLLRWILRIRGLPSAAE